MLEVVVILGTNLAPYRESVNALGWWGKGRQKQVFMERPLYAKIWAKKFHICSLI